MRVVFGRDGFLASPGGARVRDQRPDWSLAEGTGDAWRALLRDADVAVPIMSPVRDADLADSSVRLVQQLGVGTEAIDLDACAARGIPVANVPSTASPNATAVAELTVLLLLALVRDLDGQVDAVRTGRPRTPGRTLAGQRIVLIGLGGLGRTIAARLAPFGVDLAGVRAHPERGGVPGVSAVHGLDALDGLLAEADGVICCLPASGRAVLDAARFAAMRRGSIVINVARGSVVDEAALLGALGDGTVAGAGLDVLADEPPRADDPLVMHPRTIVTPHIGGVTIESLIGTADAVIANIDRFARGEPLEWRLR